MLHQLLEIFSKPKNILTSILLSGVIFLLLLIIPVYGILRSSFVIPGIPIARKWEIFYDYTINVFTTIPFIEQALVISLALLTAVNIVVFILYIKRQRRILSGRSFFSSISGMMLGLFGIGCLSCGVLIMAPLISFLGLGIYIGGITEYALVLSYSGLVLILISILYLLKKMREPLVC